ncbi:MAG: hypothetical protein E3K37_16950 [Candidatus Kuenenia sp.]|nr:hypothetical protein [Candidatus Kuenenia hertensis]
MEKNRESLEKERDRESALFWDRKARFTYYLLSLPFALFGGAIVSYKPTPSVELSQLYIEVSAWVLFLLSGLSGLVSKWGEMETARMSSVIAQVELRHIESHKNGRKPTEQDAKLSMKQENKRLNAEKAEYLGNLLLKFLFPTGCIVWLTSRLLLQL